MYKSQRIANFYLNFWKGRDRTCLKSNFDVKGPKVNKENTTKMTGHQCVHQNLICNACVWRKFSFVCTPVSEGCAHGWPISQRSSSCICMHQIWIAAGSWTRANISGCPHVCRKIKYTAVQLITIMFATFTSCLICLTKRFNTDTGQFKCDGTRADTRFRLSAKRMNPFKSAGGVSSVDYWQPKCAHQR